MLSLVFVVFCLVSDFCEDFITHSGESFRVDMSVWDLQGVLISP